jgi:SEC-C motif-containing protein
VTAGDDVQAFLDSPEAAALDGVGADARAEIARRMLAALGMPLAELASADVHGWLLHDAPERFRARDPLAAHVAPVVLAMIAFAERTGGRELRGMRAACEETLPELARMLASGRSHHHHHGPPAQPFVREAPKVGRNDPCPCGSGVKFKKCHGA